MKDLISEAYAQPDESLMRSLTRVPFNFTSPDVPFLNKALKTALVRGDPFFSDLIRNNFYPSIPDSEAQGLFWQTSNEGIQAINNATTDYLGEEAKRFLILEGEGSCKLEELAGKILQRKEKAYNGVHPRNFGEEQLRASFEAYDFCRRAGFMWWVCSINTSPEFHQALSNHRQVLSYLEKEVLQVRESEPSKDSTFPLMSSTKSGVYLFHKENLPFRRRVKGLNKEGTINYQSLLVKLLLGAGEEKWLGDINDQIGVELIVKDDEEKQTLKRYFRRHRAIGNLEKLKDPNLSGSKKRGTSSSEKFGALKFIFRAPVKAESNFSLLNVIRQPIEVQILTIKDYHQIQEDREISHEEFKRRQFLRLIPFLFPKEFYERE